MEREEEYSLSQMFLKLIPKELSSRSNGGWSSGIFHALVYDMADQDPDLTIPSWYTWMLGLLIS